jgi:hypothetical protein
MDVPVIYLVAFGLLMLISHVAGAAMSNWSFRDAARFQVSLLEERDRLRQENLGLQEQIFTLRGEILELRQRVNVAEEQVARYSLTIEEESAGMG